MVSEDLQPRAQLPPILLTNFPHTSRPPLTPSLLTPLSSHTILRWSLKTYNRERNCRTGGLNEPAPNDDGDPP